jgi:hypothetical protein
MPFLRQGPHGLGEKPQLTRLEGQFPRPALHDLAGEEDDIADVERLEEVEGLGPDGVPADESLDPAGPVLDGHEGTLAEVPDGHEPAGQAEGFLDSLEGVLVQGSESFEDDFSLIEVTFN